MSITFPIVGKFRRGQLLVQWVPSSWREIPEVDQSIENAWNAAAARPDVHLFDGPMCRLERAQVVGEMLHLDVSRTSYKPFVGTNLTNAALADRYGRNALANGIGQSTILHTADDHLLLGRRTRRVAYYPSRVHPFAGSLEPADPLDPFGDMLRELHEELALTDDDLTSFVCGGIVEDASIRQPELVYVAHTTRTADEIAHYMDDEEHLGVFRCDATGEAVARQLSGEEPFTPVGRGALLTWLRLTVGQTWFDEHRADRR